MQTCIGGSSEKTYNEETYHQKWWYVFFEKIVWVKLTVIFLDFYELS